MKRYIFRVGLRRYIFKLGKDLDTLRELIAKYIVLVFLRTQGFNIIYPVLKNSRYLWTSLAATHIVAEKNERRYALIVKYGRSRMASEEQITISQLKRAKCIPAVLQVSGDISKDKWEISWKELKA